MYRIGKDFLHISYCNVSVGSRLLGSRSLAGGHPTARQAHSEQSTWASQMTLVLDMGL